MTIIVADTKRAFYFGCIGDLGHYFFEQGGRKIWDGRKLEGFPWTMGHLDTGLLKNGKHRDVYDGNVFWTGGGTPFWLAFFWWDNSVDGRCGSNSGFYVRGFDHHRIQGAFDYAASVFPEVIARQHQPLVLQA
jgi:hypothetical protein